MIYALIAPFLKQKIRSRLKTVSTRYEDIYKALDENNGNFDNWKSILPKSLGGKQTWAALTDNTTQQVLEHYRNMKSIA
jgi:hypothetical protein